MTREMTREEALTILKDIVIPMNGNNADERTCAFNMAVEALNQEPKGHWKIARGMYEDRIWCDCGFIKVVSKDTANWKFCPVCGASKKEE